MSVRILHEENRDLPLGRVQLTFPSGAAADPFELDGLCHFASELMTRGAAGRDRAALDAAFDALGATLEVLSDYDATSFEITVLKEKLPAALKLIADVLSQPTFSQAEAEKLRRELSAHLDDLRDDDGQLARRFFGRAFYGRHPYGRTVIGTAESIARLDEKQARAWHERTIGKKHLLAGFAGDISAAEAESLLADILAVLPMSGELAPRPPDVPTRTGMRITLVDKPERTQSQILWGQPAPRWGTEAHTALQVATCAFGGTFTARLMNEVRSKRGLSYGASARMGQGRGQRALVGHVFPSLDQTVETLELVLGLHKAWVSEGITAEELEFCRSYLANSHAFSVATPEDRLDVRTQVALADLPDDFASRFPVRISAVTLEETRAAMREYLSPTDLELCVVATAGELLPRLEKAAFAWTVETVAYDSL